jgi:diketogulonate reductase-like aldo/keto reductase
MAVESLRLGLPKIVYGTAWKKEKTAELVEQAVLLGFRGIDTACQPKHYDEAGVGNAISSLQKKGINRDQIFIQTKFTPLNGQDPKRIPYDPKATLSQQVEESFRVSQKNLRSEFIDSLVLHSPLARFSQTMEAWQAMEKLVEENAVGQIGISNCYELKVFKELYEGAKVKPTILQNRFYKETGYDKALRNFCDDHKITYQSFWTLSANPHILENKKFRSLASDYKRSEAQILFRYLTQIGIVPLTGTRSEKHMRDDLAIGEFTLTDSQMQEIKSLLV